MGHHIDARGRFQSDRHSDLAPDKIVVSFKDIHAREALIRLATAYTVDDPELARDIFQRLVTIGAVGDPRSLGRGDTRGTN